MRESIEYDNDAIHAAADRARIAFDLISKSASELGSAAVAVSVDRLINRDSSENIKLKATIDRSAA